MDRLGDKDRLTGFVYAILVGAAILAGAEFMEIVPTFILGGLLIYVGLEFLVESEGRTASVRLCGRSYHSRCHHILRYLAGSDLWPLCSDYPVCG